MIMRLRLAVVVMRPPVVLLALLYLAVGATAAGAGVPGLATLIGPALAVVSILRFGIGLNDLADEQIDRINLPADPARQLLTGRRTRRELTYYACAWAGTALLIGALLGWRSALVVAGSLGLAAVYSLPPLRIAGRGISAALVLPACFVATPYLLGTLAMSDSFAPTDPWLLAGLYTTFIGRILLKDFRDVRGDTLFGKRTFLVRHGRAATCATSGAFWIIGTGLVLLALPASLALVTVLVSGVAATLVLLGLLARAPGHRREEWLISALAVVGRGMALCLLADLSATAAGWNALASGVAICALGMVSAGQAARIARDGPSPAPWEREPAAWGLVGDTSADRSRGDQTNSSH